MKVYKNFFEKIISVENLFEAWEAFSSDKRNKADVVEFGREVERYIFTLHHDLASGAYRHGPYERFHIFDPKHRIIHKAIVRDRVLHHAVFRVLNPIFEPTFISTSFSCRIGYGTHRGVDVLESFLRKASRNNSRPCFALKCDVRKFFDSVDRDILLAILGRRLKDDRAMRLLDSIVRSYSSIRERERESKGLPIGNLTSQLFANVYMNEFDQFVKHELQAKYYVRYTDDFVFVSENEVELLRLFSLLEAFLQERLRLRLHPFKVTLGRWNRGVDFLGYVSFPHHRLVRAQTRRRIFRKFGRKVEEYRAGVVSEESLAQSLQSYLGVFSHADAHEVGDGLKNFLWW